MSAAGKDYKGRSSRSNKTSLPGYMWLLAGLAIGLFIAFLVYLDKQPKEKVSFTEAITQELKKAKDHRKKTVQTAANKKKPADSKEPEFSFYTILPELEILISDSEIKSESKPEKPNKSRPDLAPTKTSYVLQAGSFRNYNDANTLKASLALLGVQSSIQSVNIKNESWHRVRIGPFNGVNELHDVRTTLLNNNIKTMTMELK